MDSKTTEVVNCFPSMQCLSGNIPDECKTGNIVCPTLPRTPSNSSITFPKTPGTNSIAVSSSDSEASADDKTPIPIPTASIPTNPQRPTRPHRRIPHTIIERRYRDNLNTQIETLRLSLPSLKNAYVCSPDVEDSALPPRLPSKAMIIATAATYIKELEAERNEAIEAVNSLQQQVNDLQKLISCNDCSILQYLQAVGGNAAAGGQGIAV
ncbi:putative transcription factor sre2 [Pseudocercospora fuligena]|uniref:Putative transcription factor sre2 n=1 Tax=Pseudocercospora fuligena TaxID=685502 RepID=A0A8H6R6A9_9PEZI|nr:putative transcription factor sre2 [Pseudocercospora fuligena]